MVRTLTATAVSYYWKNGLLIKSDRTDVEYAYLSYNPDSFEMKLEIKVKGTGEKKRSIDRSVLHSTHNYLQANSWLDCSLIRFKGSTALSKIR